MAEVKRVERYGVQTWEDAEMDTARKKGCLCLHCERFKPEQRDNCVMAEMLFGMCKTKGMAMGVSRCTDFQEAENPV